MIRPYWALSDFYAVKAIYQDSFPGYTLNALTARLNDCKVSVMTQHGPGIGEGMVQGYVIVNDNYIEQVAVHADHRGQGIGRKLLRHAERQCAGNTMWLQVLASNPAKRLYERLKYRVTSSDPNMYGIGHPGHRMDKTLAT